MDRGVTAFSCDSGRLALDLMATMSDYGLSAPTERLPDSESLERWFRCAGLAPRPLGATAVELVETRSLREALFDVVAAVTRGRLANIERGVADVVERHLADKASDFREHAPAGREAHRFRAPAHGHLTPRRARVAQERPQGM